MANIAINNYCNLQCPYCFANRYITEEEKQSITMEQLNTILEFLGRSSIGRIGIIGGEPTIHPNFSNILECVRDFCKSRDSRCTVFSNGIRLKEYARLFSENVSCLVNVNHPDTVGNKNWDDIIRSMERLRICSNLGNISLGVNLYSTLSDYDFIFELTSIYNKDTLRVSYVAPTCKFSNIDKEEYYNEAKEIFLPFVEKAKTAGVKIRLDCNHIPRCYFSDEELNFIDTVVVGGFHEYCEPVVDITPDFQGTACFGAYELFDLKDFDDINQVIRYLNLKKLYPLSQNNSSGKCSSCSKYKNLSCQGGCLAFANK